MLSSFFRSHIESGCLCVAGSKFVRFISLRMILKKKEYIQLSLSRDHLKPGSCIQRICDVNMLDVSTLFPVNNWAKTHMYR